MSPCETSEREGFLEYPTEAFSYFRSQGVAKVVCEEKHMGSRAVVIVCRSAEAARQRFGVVGDETGIVYTRTGRRFFTDLQLEADLLARIRAAMDASGFWTQFSTDWACLDCELMPWSAKAQELLRSQYAAVGASGRASLSKVVAALRKASERLAGQDGSGQSAYSTDIDELLHRHENRCEAIGQFVAAYRQYCWPVKSLDDLKLAPFHLLATEGKVHTDQDHVWHMESLAAVCDHDPAILLSTPYKIVDLDDEASIEAGSAWWLELTGRGGEGMVVKPQQFVVSGSKGLVATCGEMPWPRVPADHLRPGVHVPGESFTTAAARSGSQTVPGSSGVRPWRRGPRTLRAAGAVASSPRMRFRRAGLGERAG